MFRSYFLINIILLIIAGFLGFKFYNVLTSPMGIPSTTPSHQKIQRDVAIDVRKEKHLNETSFQMITQKDIFRPSRTAPLLDNREDMTSKQVFSKNPPKLFGTIIIDDEKTALLEDPITKEIKSYHINDSIAGFIVSDILKDKVTLLKGNKTIVVKLRDRKGFRTSRRGVSIPSRKPKERTKKRPQRLSPFSRRKNTDKNADVR